MPFNPSHIHIALVILLFTAMLMDIHAHRIHNRVWIIAALILIPMRILYHLNDPAPTSIVLAWGILITLLAWMLWITGTWGGADAKGTMLLAWAMPLIPITSTWIHPVLVAIPISLGIALAWIRFKPGALPFFGIYTPVILLILWIRWIF